MRARILASIAALLAVASTFPAAAQSVGPEIVPDFFSAPAEPAPPPLRLAESLAPRPETSLRSAEVGAPDVTNVRVVMMVTDTTNGTQKTYTNPQGAPFQPIQDTSALATCP